MSYLKIRPQLCQLRPRWTHWMLVLAVGGCNGPAEPRELSDLEQPAVNALFITLTKPTWSWDEVSGPQGSGLRASVYNGSLHPLTSILGDRFNDASEQMNLFVAKGGSGTVEWRSPEGVWLEAGLAQLVEGSRAVVLRPARSYTLSALLRDTPRLGLYRIRVDYEYPDGTRYSDYSGVFEIR